jgi:hypothetical protein
MLRRSVSAVATALVLAGGLVSMTASPASAAPNCPRFSDRLQGQPGYPPANCRLKLNKNYVHKYTWELVSSPGYRPGERVNIDIRSGNGDSFRMCSQIAGKWGTIYINCMVPGYVRNGAWFISGFGLISREWRTANVTVY